MSETINIPFSTVGYLTYKRTYARKLIKDGKEIDRTEEFPDTIERVIEACKTQLKCNFTLDEEERLREYHHSFKGSVAGRFLWQLGTSTVDRFGLASLQNCAFTLVDNIRAFTWTMDMLAVGAGVGYNIQRKHVNKLPQIRTWFKAPTRVDHPGADFIIPDSREGWVRFLGKTLKAAFLSDSPDKGHFTYYTGCVRQKGLRIKGFGGVASGPEDLVWGVQKISEILMARAGRKIRPIDALDIMNLIGYIIVAGNVRRSAQIAIGDPDDVEFLLAKRWDVGHIPKWRSMSNNSVACDDIRDLHEYFWDTYEPDANGNNREAYGLINLKLARKVGRLGDTNYPDPRVEGFNPCAEQGLEDKESCCLAEIYLPNITSKEELMDVAYLLYRVCKHSLTLPCHNKETEEVVSKNMRMGIGITGGMQATKEQLSWLDETYNFLRMIDKEYSEEHGFNQSIKLTTVKPSGTLSLLPGVTPGAHPGYAKFMIRRITVDSEHPLVQVCKDHGYNVEYRLNIDGSQDFSSVIVEFPFRYKDGTRVAAEVNAIDQLEFIRFLQANWSDNSVSCTIYFKPEELNGIKEYLKRHYQNNFKTLSFLLHSEHGFKQAPYEEITEEQYNEIVARTKVITGLSSAEYESNDECASGVCPIR